MAPELWTQGAECAMKLCYDDMSVEYLGSNGSGRGRAGQGRETYAYSAMAAAYRVTSVLCSDVQNMAVAGMVVVLVVSGCWVVGGRRATQRRRRAGKGVTTGAKGGDGTIAHTLKAKRIVQQPRDRGSAVVGKQKKTRWDEMRERKRESTRAQQGTARRVKARFGESIGGWRMTTLERAGGGGCNRSHGRRRRRLRLDRTLPGSDDAHDARRGREHCHTRYSSGLPCIPTVQAHKHKPYECTLPLTSSCRPAKPVLSILAIAITIAITIAMPPPRPWFTQSENK